MDNTPSNVILEFKPGDETELINMVDRVVPDEIKRIEVGEKLAKLVRKGDVNIDNVEQPTSLTLTSDGELYLTPTPDGKPDLSVSQL